jgi:hypothetical protein
MQGQVNFDSGWEWGSWIQDVITARAAWNPFLEIDDQFTGFSLLLPYSPSMFKY